MMSFFRANPLVAWGLGAAIILGGIAGAYIYNKKSSEAPAQLAAVDPQDSGETSKTGETPSVQQGSDENTDTGGEPPLPGEPRFDVLRVEKDGSVVVAGNNAPAGSTVELVRDGKVIATTKAGAGGDFAIVLDQPLDKGAHELSLRATGESGEMVTSAETGIVNVPEEGGELLAMVSREGEATRVLQKPEDSEQPAAQVAEASGESAATEEVAASEQAADGSTKAAQADVSSDEQEEIEVAKVEPAPEPEAESGTQSADPAPVLISAIDVENGRIFVAGTGEPGRVVTIYLDGEKLGSARIGAEGGFLLEAGRDLKAGNYEVRADMLSTDGAAVTRRAAVRLVHDEPAASTAVAEAEDAPAQEAQEQTASAAGSEAEEEQQVAAVDGQSAQEADTTPSAAEEPASKEPDQSADVEPDAKESEEPVAVTETEEPAEETQETAATQPETSGGGEQTEQQVAVSDGGQVPEIKSGASVIIRRGDNLWRISRRMLGRGIRYTVIYEANRNQIRDPNLIFPGQVFDVPGAKETMDRG